jgi:hypothetical protein
MSWPTCAACTILSNGPKGQALQTKQQLHEPAARRRGGRCLGAEARLLRKGRKLCARERERGARPRGGLQRGDEALAREAEWNVGAERVERGAVGRHPAARAPPRSETRRSARTEEAVSPPPPPLAGWASNLRRAFAAGVRGRGGGWGAPRLRLVIAALEHSCHHRCNLRRARRQLIQPEGRLRTKSLRCGPGTTPHHRTDAQRRHLSLRAA